MNTPPPVLDRAAATLDLERPVAITLFGVLPFVGGDTEARRAFLTRNP
ncbi:MULTISPECIES: hypothetical protein [unclassified Nocardiopsis]